MNPDLLNAYLLPQPTSQWRWSNDGTVIEWSDASTVVFREELVQILARLAESGLPPLDSVILVLAATRDSFPEFLIDPDDKNEFMQSRWFDELLVQLKRLNRFPKELRSDMPAKLEIVAQVFQRFPNRLSAKESQSIVSALVADFRCEYYAHRPSPGIPGFNTGEKTKKHCRDLCNQLMLIDEHALRLRLETGLDQLPNLPTPVEVEEEPEPEQPTPPPEPTVHDLLQELAKDKEFTGFAKLVRNLTALISIPQPLEYSDELPLGGVSDITNRGPLDKLLLSELAYDNDTLMTRVALNEALYLRREQPPALPSQQRHILIDTGIRMWGVPRVFASAIAMALAVKSKESQQGLLFRSEGENSTPFQLTTKEELTEHLAILSPEATAVDALKTLIENTPPEADLVLITCPRAWQDRNFRRWLLDEGPTELFAFLVDRIGNLQLIQHTPRGDKLIRQATLNLDTLFSEETEPKKTKTPKLIQPDRDNTLPAIFGITPFPLRIPHQIDWRNSWIDQGQIISITHNKQLCVWEYNEAGPRILRHQLPAKNVVWASRLYQDQTAHVVVGHPGNGELHLLRIDLNNDTVQGQQLHGINAPVLGVVSHLNSLFIIQKGQIVEFSLIPGKKVTQYPIPPYHVWSGNSRYFRDGGNWTALCPGGKFELTEKYDHRHSTIGVFETENGPTRIALEDIAPTTKSNSSIYPSYCTLKVSDAAGSYSHEFPEAMGDIIAISRLQTVIFVMAMTNPPQLFRIDTFQRNIECIRKDYLKPSNKAYWSQFIEGYAYGKFQQKQLRNKIKQVAVSDKGLFLRGHHGRNWLHLTGQSSLQHIDKTFLMGNPKIVDFHQCTSQAARSLRLKQATFPDGSTIYLDPRGMLHLKSSSAGVPETTIVLHDEAVSGWCSNGFTFGDQYFINETAGIEHRTAFWKEALLPFIQKVI